MSIPLIADEYPFESLSQPWFNAEVERATGKKRYEIIDRSTGERYRQEPITMIAFKCFLLSLATPYYLSGYMAFHLARIPFAIISERSLKTLLPSIKAVVKAPFYAIAFEFAALYGIFKPLEGRALLSKIELRWHEKTRKQNVALLNQTDSEILWNGLTQTDYPYVLHLAPCMQSLGSIHDEGIKANEFAF